MAKFERPIDGVRIPRKHHRKDEHPPDPGRDLLHYCRSCTATFESTTRDSAHRLALTHVISQHDRERQYERCSRYCDLRAQAEEIGTGLKLYGEGSARPAPPVPGAYKRLFPEDES